MSHTSTVIVWTKRSHKPLLRCSLGFLGFLRKRILLDFFGTSSVTCSRSPSILSSFELLGGFNASVSPDAVSTCPPSDPVGAGSAGGGCAAAAELVFG